MHNAAAGYWTISTGCMEAANSVAGFEYSASLTIFDALIQSQAEQRPVLLSFYDAPCSDVLYGLMGNEHAFSASMIVAPVDSTLSLPVYRMNLQTKPIDWPTFKANEVLESCYENNPVAKILPLLKMLSTSDNKKTVMPLSSATNIQISIQDS